MNKRPSEFLLQRVFIQVYLFPLYLLHYCPLTRPQGHSLLWKFYGMFFRTNVVRMFEDFTGHYEHFCGSLQSVYMKKQNSSLRPSGADFRE